MENRRRRYINFDLDSANLRALLGGENGRKKAYSIIKKYMLSKAFEHRQGSAYISLRPFSDAEIYDLTDGLVRLYPWLAVCVKGYDVTNVGTTHDYIFVFRQYTDEAESPTDDDILV